MVNKYIDWYLENYRRQTKEVLNYPDGCVMTGVQGIYEAEKQDKYLDVLCEFGDKYVDEEGNVSGYQANVHNVDQLRCGTVFLYLYRKTGEARYRKAADQFRENLRTFPRLDMGNFWHKEIYPYQVWLDGLYMAMPFYLEYTELFGGEGVYEDVAGQFVNVRKHLYIDDKKIYKHAYDEKKVQVWADPSTGLSPNFWGRAEGWYLMALADCIPMLEKTGRKEAELLKELLAEAVEGIIRYQDEQTGLFYQLLDLPNQAGNYTETSASAMIGYALMKGTRIGVLPGACWEKGKEIFDAVCREKLKKKDGIFHLVDICASAGLGPGAKRDGSIAYYLSEKCVDDNAHGAAALMMAYGEILQKAHGR